MKSVIIRIIPVAALDTTNPDFLYVLGSDGEKGFQASFKPTADDITDFGTVHFRIQLRLSAIINKTYELRVILFYVCQGGGLKRSIIVGNRPLTE